MRRCSASVDLVLVSRVATGPELPFVHLWACCGAARQTGLSPQAQILRWANSQFADKVAVRGSGLLEGSTDFYCAGKITIHGNIKV